MRVHRHGRDAMRRPPPRQGLAFAYRAFWNSRPPRGGLFASDVISQPPEFRPEFKTGHYRSKPARTLPLPSLSISGAMSSAMSRARARARRFASARFRFRVDHSPGPRLACPRGSLPRRATFKDRCKGPSARHAESGASNHAEPDADRLPEGEPPPRAAGHASNLPATRENVLIIE
jgi:hypothetical protein